MYQHGEIAQSHWADTFLETANHGERSSKRNKRIRDPRLICYSWWSVVISWFTIYYNFIRGGPCDNRETKYLLKFRTKTSKESTRFYIFAAMLNSFMTFRTKMKTLLKFFLNSHSRRRLCRLVEEFGGSTNTIRHELNNLSCAGYVVTSGRENIIGYSANVDHPLYPESKNLVHKYMGIDKTLDHIVKKVIGHLGSRSRAS